MLEPATVRETENECQGKYVMVVKIKKQSTTTEMQFHTMRHQKSRICRRISSTWRLRPRFTYQEFARVSETKSESEGVEVKEI